jgi:hypothetical protein
MKRSRGGRRTVNRRILVESIALLPIVRGKSATDYLLFDPEMAGSIAPCHSQRNYGTKIPMQWSEVAIRREHPGQSRLQVYT